MRLISTAFLIILFTVKTAFAQPQIELQPVASGFTYPVLVSNAGDDRLFVVQRQGKIIIIDELGDVLATPYLDITPQIESGYEERGLLGLAFHPDYDENGYFFVSYTDNDGNSVISRYTVSGDDNIADEDSEVIIFTADQPYSNHNGGCILFGQDGYLYISLGDGGSGGDPGNRAQNPENKLGKIHRIDVDGAEPYAIPPDNPFVGAADTLETIWSLGVRNVWRFSFDRETGDMWLADVGQNLYEEVNFEAAGDGGHNYGWRCYEGNTTFNPSGCEGEEFYTFPIMDYNHSFATGGYSVTGGYRYRGEDYPGMYGYYLVTDFVSGNWWWIRENLDGSWQTEFLDDIEDDIAGFGEDVDGELYCTDLYSGIVYKITDACGAFSLNTEVDSFYCDESLGNIDLSIDEGTPPYDILWSTGSTEEDINDLTPGTYSVEVIDSEGCVRQVEVEVEVGELEIPVITFDGTTLSADIGASWQWFVDGVEIVDANDQNYLPMENGVYYALVTLENGCIVQSDDLSVTLNSIYAEDDSEFSISPNPARDAIVIQTPAGFDVESIQISDQTGRVVASHLFPHAATSAITIPINELPEGIYNVLITGEYVTIHRSLIKTL